MRLLLIIYFFLFLAAAQSVFAYGFGISPSELNFAVEKGAESSRQLILHNTGSQVKFTAASDNGLVSVSPASGIVPENGKTAVAVAVSGNRAGEFHDTVTVRFFNPDDASGVSLGLGMSVAVRISVTEPVAAQASIIVGSLISTGIIASGLSAYLAAKRLKKAQHL